MSTHSGPRDADEVERQLIDWVRSSEPDGPDDSTFWALLAKRQQEASVSAEVQAEAVRLAALALAIARGELSLGKYLAQLRGEARLSREAVSRDARLAPNVIGGLEGDRWAVAAIEPARLARVAVLLGAAKRVLLELVRMRLTGAQLGPAASARLARLDRGASHLTSERALRRTRSAEASQSESYLRELSSAFDAEAARTPQP